MRIGVMWMRMRRDDDKEDKKEEREVG